MKTVSNINFTQKFFSLPQDRKDHISAILRGYSESEAKELLETIGVSEVYFGEKRDPEPEKPKPVEIDEETQKYQSFKKFSIAAKKGSRWYLYSESQLNDR